MLSSPCPRRGWRESPCPKSPTCRLEGKGPTGAVGEFCRCQSLDLDELQDVQFYSHSQSPLFAYRFEFFEFHARPSANEHSDDVLIKCPVHCRVRAARACRRPPRPNRHRESNSCTESATRMMVAEGTIPPGHMETNKNEIHYTVPFLSYIKNVLDHGHMPFQSSSTISVAECFTWHHLTHHQAHSMHSPPAHSAVRREQNRLLLQGGSVRRERNRRGSGAPVAVSGDASKF